ncbi:tetratricopeptide repeat protein [Gluconacetobacter sacchari]|uniref:tetratricopeptide repeat protein n=1 Tax=Gluconacetobacter sacchari TaxID=92759 RepID=UPI0039B4699E
MGWFFGKGGKAAGLRRPESPSPARKNRTIPKAVSRLTREANRLRDAQDFLLAAETYEQAVELAPWRTDLIVQSGNMYKDGGLLADAVDAYHKALRDSPDDADIHMQLGHALKLMGRRPAAMACYRKALALVPGYEAALHELAHSGIAAAQVEQGDAFMRHGGVEAILALVADLGAMRAKLEDLERRLPDMTTWAAVPDSRYGLFRRLFDIPPAPPPHSSSGRQSDLTFIFPADYVTPERLHIQLNALRLQTSNHWRAVFFGCSKTNRAAIERIAVADRRVNWLQVKEDETETAAERRACEETDGWLVLLASGAVPHTRAAEWFTCAASLAPMPPISCDASIRATGAATDGYDSHAHLASATDTKLLARWAFDPDLLLQRNIWGDTLVVPSTLYASLSSQVDAQPTLAGRRSALLLAAGNVAHLPFALVDLAEDEEDTARLDAHYAAVEHALGSDATSCHVTRPPLAPMNGDHPIAFLRIVRPLPPERASLTVIMCTRNNAADCQRMVRSLIANATAPELLTCLIVDNGTDKEEDKALLTSVALKHGARLFPLPGPFNWSYLNNKVADEIQDGILVFANDDMEMLSAGWDDRLRAHLAAPEIGAVGAKLLYQDGTIQHAGILFGWNDSVIHDGLFESSTSTAQMGRWQVQRRVTAVTGAFLAIRKSTFTAVGGFDASELAISYSDVDLCLKLRQAGLFVRWDPELLLFHFESKSRGLDCLTPEKAARDMSERQNMYARWGKDTFRYDQTFNPVWHDATIPFRLLRPVDASRAIQHLCGNDPI